MLPIMMDEEAIEKIVAEARAGREVEVDLPAQAVKTVSPSADGGAGEVLLGMFEVDEFKKHCLVNGLDDIGLTMQMERQIRAFERRRTQRYPWLDGTGYLRRAERTGPVKVEAAPVPKTNRGDVKTEPLEW